MTAGQTGLVRQPLVFREEPFRLCEDEKAGHTLTRDSSMTLRINRDQDITTLSLEDRVSLFRAVRSVRLSMDKEAESMKAFESKIQNSLIEDIPKSGEGVVSSGYLAKVETKKVPTIKDWNLLVPVIVQSGRFDWLQKRLADKAVTDTENWESIPGLEVFNAVKLSVTKI